MNLITINLCLRNKLNQFKSEKVNHKSYYKNNNNKMKNKKHYWKHHKINTQHKMN